MNKKQLIVVRIIGIFGILYGLFGILNSIQPPTTIGHVKIHHIPIVEIPLLIFGLGILLLRNWARIGMMYTCLAFAGLIIYNTIVPYLLDNYPISIINIIFIVFCFIIYYFLNRKSVIEIFMT